MKNKYCELCGEITATTFRRWYKYDNGEQFNADICSKCVKRHDALLKVESNKEYGMSATPVKNEVIA
jgi:hypothetical protein